MTVATPPQNLAAERSVLGAVLLSDRVLRPLIVEVGLRPEHFHVDRHRLIWRAMTEMSDAQQHVDVVTVTAHLATAGTLDAAGGAAGIDELTGEVPGLGGVRRYGELVVEAWRWRTRLTATFEQQAAVASADAAAFEVALQRASALAVVASDTSFVEPVDLAECAWRDMTEAPTAGLPLPVELPGLGRMMRLRPGHVTVVTGWSHHGKTLLALQLAARVGEDSRRVVIWTNEDTKLELVARYLNRVTGIPACRITDRALSDDDLAAITTALGRLPFGVQECHGWSALQVARHVRQVRPVAAVVDHFHALPGVSKADGVDDAMQLLVAAAGQTQCHLVVVCQLNQERLKQVCRPAPVARDLRGSGQIFNLAHNVLAVYLQEEELEDASGRRLGRPVQLEEGHVDVLKNKATGGLGAVAVRFDSRRLRFVEAVAA